MKSPSLKVIDFDSVVKNTKVAKSILFHKAIFFSEAIYLRFRGRR